jgi:malate synthase
MSQRPQSPAGLLLRFPPTSRQAELLSPAALAFVAELERRFGPRRRELLAHRAQRQARLDAGEKPGFLSETAAIRAGDWKVAAPARDLTDRRVEITGPVDRKMVINALNSGANVFMADFEDSNSPTWQNCLDGQLNLRDAVRREIVYTHPETKKRYELAPRTATLVVRPRGWHLEEANLTLDGRPLSASLFDFGLYFFHNAAESVKRGSGPYFYLPKLESHLEARLWNDVFLFAQEALGLTRGTIRATVLIETILAAFEMDEILYELREHSSGLNCGRWDYIFSFIKKFQAHGSSVFPDRGSVGMDRHFLRSYSQLLIQTCHRRGAHAMGGMAAQIPIKDDPARNQAALDKVRADKRREAGDGHDGTWVAHPGLVPIAREEFDRVLSGPNQLHVLREDVHVRAEDLLSVPEGQISEAGLRANLEIGMTYLEAWLSGVGCVPIHHLMEDAATAEISRAQVWAWLRHGARLSDGRRLTGELFGQVLGEELGKIRARLGEQKFSQSRFALAAQIFDELIRAPRCPDFLTLAAYGHLDHAPA